MISVRHLQKKFGTNIVLSDVNAEINEGEVISVIGPSGTGKSTFLRCLNRLETPTSGEIYVDGDNIMDKNVNLNLVRQKMGMVFQSFNLFSHLMVIENLMLGPVELLKMNRTDAYNNSMAMLDIVGLKNKYLAYPDELSGGQKQRIAIARTLVMNPKIVLFDEPTSALDPTMVGEVLGVIRKLAERGLTMMVVTHEMSFARDVSTRIFYMDEGIIYEDNTPQVIFKNPEREKTRAFILKLRSLPRLLTSASFDFYGLNSEIEEFGRKFFFSQKQINNIQLIFEEIVLQKLNDSYPVEFSVNYSETTNEVEITFSYEGKRYNPFETSDEDLSVMIISRLAKTIEYDYGENQNKISIKL